MDAEQGDLARQRAAVEEELAGLVLELQGLDQGIQELQARVSQDLTGFPSARLREVAAQRLRDEAKLTADQMAADELRRRCRVCQQELARIEAEQQAATLHALDLETQAAARVFVGQFEKFLQDLVAFREVYWRNREAGARRQWPITGYSPFSKHEYQWHGELVERLEKFQAVLTRAEAGQDE